MSLREQITEILQRTTNLLVGEIAEQIPSRSRDSVAVTVATLARRGDLLKATGSGKSVRYSLLPGFPKPGVLTAPDSVTPFNPKRERLAASKAVPGGPARLPGEPVRTSKTRYTVCPSMPQPTQSNTHWKT